MSRQILPDPVHFCQWSKRGFICKRAMDSKQKDRKRYSFPQTRRRSSGEPFFQILIIRLLSGIEEVVDRIFEEKNKELELLLPVTETEIKPKSSFLTRADTETERQAYFKGDGIRRGYDIEVR